MSISEAARRTELSIDTIRYYDKLGILGPLSRTAGGARTFGEPDVGWLKILRCLRDTGMSMADLRKFVAVDGDLHPGKRRQLLEDHRATVLQRMARLEQELTVLDGKIAAYRAAEERGAEPATAVR